MAILPPFLDSGDAVHLVSSARRVAPEMVENAENALSHHGLRAILVEDLYAVDHQFAGTDARRAAAVQEALDSPESKAVLFMRGGYGTQRIIDRLDLRRFGDHPKWVVGFSDLTTLHSHVNNVLDVASLHHAMASTYPLTSENALNEGIMALKGVIDDVSFSTESSNLVGKASGKLIGGNLSVLHTLMGTPSELNSEGAILFIEDLDEMLYHLDRMLLHMLRAQHFAGLKGVIVGGFSDMRDNTEEYGFSKDDPFGKDAHGILHEHLGTLGIPVAFGFPAGHIRENRPLILGTEVGLMVEEGRSFLHYR